MSFKSDEFIFIVVNNQIVIDFVIVFRSLHWGCDYYCSCFVQLCKKLVSWFQPSSSNSLYHVQLENQIVFQTKVSSILLH
jgi:hypothetical protein